MSSAVLVMKILVVTSIYFVWVVRYENIIKEFKEYNLPDWLRDLTGILKMSFSFMLIFPDKNNVLDLIGSAGIAALMLCAQITHLKTGTSLFRRLPSLLLLLISVFIFYSGYHSV